MPLHTFNVANIDIDYFFLLSFIHSKIQRHKQRPVKCQTDEYEVETYSAIICCVFLRMVHTCVC